MKKNIFLFFFIFIAFTSYSQEETTTYYLIRHAEKIRIDKNNKNPSLNKKGIERAKKWATVFRNVDFDMVYSTNYNRTIQTVSPTAVSKNLKIQFYKPREIYDDIFKKTTKGKTVLIVGHSNTTPYFANRILGKNKYKKILDSYNGSLYIITITKNVITDILLKLD